MSYESVLCVIRECFVYRIPPRSSATGYRANDWDVNQFLWTGRLRVIAIGDDCALHLEDNSTGELFGKCPIHPDGSSVEAVMDSSRYFVIKIVDGGTGQHAFVGLGFPERSYAFDMNVALQDHAKRVRGANEITTSSKLADLPPPVDYSLKEGQKIQIKLGNKTIAAKESGGSKEAEDLSKFSIAPPPASKPIESVQWGTGGTDDFEGDFGDFKGGVFGESKEGNKGGWTSFE